ncbi:MAG: polyprenyl-phospho-N-acetylgalactosaminyl synthase [Thermosediminibacterales bacterium]|nr:polyprenyl-phospho-N-acetylgalactosaminyl synthase [Thermosediminibacterales bacterium]MDK2836251.1 polyprenyl-phospho-N-acetylgalactosaminyl synthase [Thermosediminibacterales bacterium]
MPKVGVIIPAFNEAPRISDVLNRVIKMPFFDKIVVVDDGSTDETFSIARKYPVNTLKLEKNLGKGAALQHGLSLLKNVDICVFLDADLINLNENHVQALISPLLEDSEMDMSIGVFYDRRKKSVDLAQKYFSILNGQRALSRKFIDTLPDLSWSRFGVEVLLSKYAKKTGAKVTYPPLEGISHYTKEEKLGFYRGFIYRLQMYKEVLYTLFNYNRYI